MVNNLFILEIYEDGSVLVGDCYGETEYLLKDQYKLYLENIKNLKDDLELKELKIV